MTPFAFDTLSASKQLREAGMPEGVAEAVVSVFQHASAMPDISHLATKADLDALSVATKADVERLSGEFEALRKEAVTKADLQAAFGEIRAEFGVKLLQQTWMMIGGVTALVTMVNVTLKIFS